MKRDDSGKYEDFEFNDFIGFHEHWPAEEKVKASLDRTLAAIDIEESTATDVPVIKGPRYGWRWIAAASFTGMLTLGAFLVYQGRHPKNISYATAYGNTHQLILPDSSLVILNAHSRLNYKPWKTTDRREVWLEGEAFFDIRKDQQPFTVHSSTLTVEVLGTAFDIRQRRGKTEIVLQSGKIRVTFNDDSHKPVILNPGDMLSFDPQAQTLSHTTTIASDYTAWTNGKLLLPDPDVTQITQYLEDNFGYQVVLKDPALAHKKVEGPILFDNLDDVLFVLSRVLNVDITKQDSTLIFTPR